MQAYPNNPALRGHLESQVNFLSELTQKTYDSMRKLSELNMHLAQQMIEDSMNMGRSMMQCSDPFQMTSTAMNGLQPATEHLRTYQQQLMGVLAGAQVDLTRSAETSISEASRSASAMADQMVRSASASATAAENAAGSAARNAG
ncbi:phasin family protein [Massilia horti]|nr:phasin family protein [Massilia horti]